MSMGAANWVNHKDNPEERGVDLPDSVVISEEGPREGFQIEKGPIATADKIALIDALSACGLAAFRSALSSIPSMFRVGPMLKR